MCCRSSAAGACSPSVILIYFNSFYLVYLNKKYYTESLCGRTCCLNKLNKMKVCYFKRNAVPNVGDVAAAVDAAAADDASQFKTRSAFQNSECKTRVSWCTCTFCSTNCCILQYILQYKLMHSALHYAIQTAVFCNTF